MSGIMRKRSEFFNRALSGNWSEKKDRLVELPEDDPEIFAFYINIIYTGAISSQTDNHRLPNNELQAYFLAIVKSYILAEKLQDKQAKNTALLTLHTVTVRLSFPERLPNAEIVDLMYKNTSKGSLGRRLMVDIWNNNYTKTVLEKSESICKDFFVDLAYSIYGQRQKKPSVAWDMPSTTYEEEL
ncbi:uncharacterized protein J4E87_004168 [Alternaria ethzedia]|uniref:uncharacterized protein n=1 Tax=Alternaria ethzedia TaxID=181014 RepID=UPI0020C54CAD|nr:uncharacterized protein J4E87_004168 [Alternaria ethzedia]KAI4627604.1 hypothetical protein J4E87_004168 [Alternaria ethzedia]